MIRFDEVEPEQIDEITGVEFAYYDSEYLMTSDGVVYRKFSSGYKPASTVLSTGTLKLIMSSKGRRKLISIPKLVKLLLHGEERDRKWIVEHKDGDKMNCHPDNLEWAKFKGRNHGVK